MPIRTISKTIDLVKPSEPVSKYITKINKHGITIHPENQEGIYIQTTDTIYNSNKNYYYINNNQYVPFTGDSFNENVTYYEKMFYSIGLNGLGLDIFKNQSTVAHYGETIRVGPETGFHITIDGRELGFFDGAQRVAYVNNQKLSINQSVVLEQMDVGRKIGEPDPFAPDDISRVGAGQWSWKVHKNSEGKNNLYLKWIG